MSKKLVLLGLLVFQVFVLLAQGNEKEVEDEQQKETIQLKKGKTSLYRGVNQEIANWYLYMDADETCYLANLSIPEQEVEAWFELRKNSDNLFKGIIQNGMYPTLIMTKENEQETYLKFYVKRENDGTLTLSSIEDAEMYSFRKK